MKRKRFLTRIGFIILVFFLALKLAIAQEITKVKLNTEVISVDIDLLLNEDGSVDITMKLLEKVTDIKEIKNLTNMSTFVIKIADSKSVQDLRIKDLSIPDNPIYTETSTLIPYECAGKFIFNRSNNDVIACTNLNKEGELFFELKYKYLQDISCFQEERIRQNVSFILPSQKNTYYAKITTRVVDTLNYLIPQNCLEGWTKHNIIKGIVCEKKDMYYYDVDYELELSLPITGEIKNIVKAREENKLQNKLKFKNIVLQVVIAFMAIVTYLGYKEKINSVYNNSKRNKIISWGIIILILLIYALFLWW